MKLNSSPSWYLIRWMLSANFGEDYEAAVVPEKARAVLSHFDERSQH